MCFVGPVTSPARPLCSPSKVLATRQWRGERETEAQALPWPWPMRRREPAGGLFCFCQAVAKAYVFLHEILNTGIDRQRIFSYPNCLRKHTQYLFNILSWYVFKACFLILVRFQKWGMFSKMVLFAPKIRFFRQYCT